MRPFYKLALLLGVMSVVSPQGHSAQGTSDFLAKDLEVARPGAGQSSKPVTIRFLDAINEHISKATWTGKLRDIDVDTWSAPYKQATGQEFSPLRLVELLDRTKSEILYRWARKESCGTIYDVILLTDLIHKSFQSGLVDQPAEKAGVDRLIQIYARAVSTTLVLDDAQMLYANIHKPEILHTLKKGKENAPPSKKRYFTALQEYVFAISDSYHEKEHQDSPYRSPESIRFQNSWKPHELEKFNREAGTSLTSSDLEQLLKTVGFQVPLSFKPEPEYLFPLQTTTTRPLSDLFIPQSSGKDSRDSKDSKDSKGRP